MIEKFFNFFRKKKVEVENKRTLLSSLAPKVLTKAEDIEKIQPYLDKIKETIDTEGISNIALTGGYGSGKSTIIGTFKELNSGYKYLNISLASFNKKEEDKDINPVDKKIQKEELERLLEVSILQQIFYHVKPKQIPESRFKRIDNISGWRIFGISVSFVLWVVCTTLLLKFNYLDKINPNNWITKNKFDWWSLPIFLISLTGLGILSKLVINLFGNSKINKVNIKGELELGDNVNKSVFNEHLEEILYFFERTKYNVVIIEDLDRFDSTDIFTKLREINILLNNSLLIDREINFVYAVGDDLFKDRKERVKFFEYIIPVIPFINSSNADEQLSLLIKESGLHSNIFTKEFISDITTFIDDIDMRLLTNIFQEFVIYLKTLKPEFIKKNDELFAMITYKNLYPTDFTQLNRKEGKLYSLIDNKKTYIKEFINKINKEIETKNTELENIQSEIVPNIKELRSLYINKIISTLPQNAVLVNAKLDDLVKDTEFENLINKNIEYIVYSFYTNSYYIKSAAEKIKFNFSTIEHEVNPNYTYEERVELIESKHNDKINSLKNDLDMLKSQKSQIQNWDLKQIFTKVDVNQYLDDFSDNKLLRNLILNGYINENYNDYISLFHEVSITKEDFTFERNVKSGYNTEFSYKLSDKIENLVEKIDERYFEREAILNFDLLNFIGNNYYKYSTKYDSTIRFLSNEKMKSIEFIDGYIEDENRPLKIFIEKLTENWKRFWDYIYFNSNYSEDKVNKYLQLIIRFSEIDTIIDNQNHISLTKSIEQNPQFLSLVKNENGLNYFGKISKLIRELDVQFEKLEHPTKETEELFNYVFNNHFYKINGDNILQMLITFGKDKNIEESFNLSNYSTILKSECNPLILNINSNITFYINNVYLKLEDNILEEEESLIKLLNNAKIEEKLKIKIIQKVETKITELNKINDLYIKSKLLLNNKVIPKWSNVVDYYTISENMVNENLIEFLEFEDVNEELSKLKLSEENEAFEESILVCNNISDETYNKLMNSIYFSYNTLDFKNLNEKKVSRLTKNILNTTKSNYDLLRENFANNHIVLIERNFTKFYNDLDEFETDEEDKILLLKSEKISLDNKILYLSKLEENIIVESKKMSELVGDLILLKGTKILFESSTLNSIIKSAISYENGVKLVNLYSDSLNDTDLKEGVRNIGYSYKELFLKQHKPTYKRTEYNFKLLNTLKSKGLIKNFDVDKKNEDLFRVIANY